VALYHQLRALSPYKLVQLDSADEASIVRAAEELKDETIDVLINNAGVLEKENLENTQKAGLMKQFEINAVGPFLVTRAFLPQLKAAVAASGSAFVAQISSDYGSFTEAVPRGLFGYRASKAALNMITRSLSIDLKDEKIACVMLHPGFVATDMNAHSGPVSQADSVAGLTKVIAATTLADNGRYCDYTGRNMTW
jgi:NAD(P)-dependent dehydrogenase (short-subunit alcohol dehydrogenase family)